MERYFALLSDVTSTTEEQRTIVPAFTHQQTKRSNTKKSETIKPEAPSRKQSVDMFFHYWIYFSSSIISSPNYLYKRGLISMEKLEDPLFHRIGIAAGYFQKLDKNRCVCLKCHTIIETQSFFDHLHYNHFLCIKLFNEKYFSAFPIIERYKTKEN